MAQLIINPGARCRWAISLTQPVVYPVPVGYEAEWVPDPVWGFWRKRSVVYVMNRNRVLRLRSP
jgi:hypothetical protein